MFRQLFDHLRKDHLFKNSIYLMLSTGAMAVFGFIFWILVAHFYRPQEVGIASTLISSMNFIAYLSLLGFNSTFIRFLPRSRSRNQQINTGLILVGAAALVISGAYVLVAPHFVSKLSLLHIHVLFGVGFILFALGASVNLVTDSIFIAYRAAHYNLLVDGIIGSCTQLSLPLLLIALGSYGIYAAQGLAAFVAMVASIFFLCIKFKYNPRLTIDRSILGELWHYSLGNYTANLLNILPTVAIPIVILNRLGASAAGYYYLAFMMATLLFTIAYAVTQSLFAEGSYAETHHGFRQLIRRTVFIVSSILIPGMLVLIFGGQLILEAFGRSYSHGALHLLQIFGLAAPAVALYTISVVMLRITHQSRALILMNVLYCSVIIVLTEAWAGNGLAWVGLAWLLGNLVAGLAGIIAYTMRSPQHAST